MSYSEIGEVRKVSTFDTTLRDGEQAPGNSMNVVTKVALFRKLDAAGIDVIEVGFPTASPLDLQAVVEILAILRRSKACLFARDNMVDLQCCLDVIRRR